MPNNINNSGNLAQPWMWVMAALLTLGHPKPGFADEGDSPIQGQTIELQPGDTVKYHNGDILHDHLSLALIEDPDTAPPVILNVEEGVATQLGQIVNLQQVSKRGAGVLSLSSGAFHPDTRLHVTQGGLHLGDFATVSGPITVGQGAWLGGAPLFGLSGVKVQPGGLLAPGQTADGNFADAGQPVNFMVFDSLVLEDDATVALRIWPDVHHDRIHVGPCTDTATACGSQLNGTLLALPQGLDSDWENITNVIYDDIVISEQSFDGSRFTAVQAALPWLEPSLHYREDDMAVSLSLAVADIADPDPKPDPKPKPKPKPKPPKKPPKKPKPVDPPQPEPDPQPDPEPTPEPVPEDAPEPEPQPEPAQQPEEPVEQATAPEEPPAVVISRPRPEPSGWANAVANWLMEDSRFIRQAITHTGAQQPGLWLHGYHARGKRRSASPMNNHYRDITRDIDGVIMGFGTDLNPHWRLGGAIGGAHSRIRGGLAATSRIETTHMGLYAYRQFDRAELTLGAALDHHRINNRRTARAGHLAHGVSFSQRGQTRQVFGRLAMDAWGQRDHPTRVQPFIEAVWLQHHVGAAQESGGPLALSWSRQRHTRVETSLGVHAQHPLNLAGIHQAKISASVAWRHHHGKRHLNVPQRYRHDPQQTRLDTLAGGRLSQHASLPRQRWDLGLGLQAQIGRRSLLSLAYRGSHGRRWRDHGMQLALSKQF